MVVEPMGPHTDLAVRPVGGKNDRAQEITEDAEFTARVSNETDATEGETVRLVIETDQVDLFGPDTGENLLV